MIKLSSNLHNLVKRSAKASPMSDYAVYGGAGALGGAGLGALINYLRDKSVAEGALVGGGLGGAAGLGTRGIMDLLAKEDVGLPTSSAANPGRRALDQLTGPGGVVGAMGRNVIQGGIGDLQQQLNNERAQEALIADLKDLQVQNSDYQAAQKFLSGQHMSAADRLAAIPATQRLLKELVEEERALEQNKNRAALRSAGADYGANFNDFVRLATRRAQEKQRQDNTARIMGLDKKSSARGKRAASSASDYAMYGGAGALGGAGLGALINYLQDKSVAQGALVGGGLGGAAGLGTRGIMDLLKGTEYTQDPVPGHGDEAVEYYRALQAARDQAAAMPYRGDVEKADADAAYENSADLRLALEELAIANETLQHLQAEAKAKAQEQVRRQLAEYNQPSADWVPQPRHGSDAGVLPPEIPPQFRSKSKK